MLRRPQRRKEEAVSGMMKRAWCSFGVVFMPKNPEQAASLILALGGMGSFWIGRLTGSWLMKYIAPSRLLGIYAVINTFLSFIVVLRLGWLSVIALFSTFYFFMSLMFPTIFLHWESGEWGPRLLKKLLPFWSWQLQAAHFVRPLMEAVMADILEWPLLLLFRCAVLLSSHFMQYGPVKKPGISCRVKLPLYITNYCMGYEKIHSSCSALSVVQAIPSQPTGRY